MEIWKAVPIKEFSKLYLISNKGRLKNAKRNKVLSITYDRYGYPHYLLCAKAERLTITAHRLVALAFIENPLNLPCVNHKDEDKTNNSVDNLEWCTVRYNNNYGSRNKRAAEKMSKPIAQIKNGEIVAKYRNSKEAEKQTGIDFSKIRMCCRGERKRAGGYEWKEIEEE